MNVLEEMENDTRTPDKLIDGCNDSADGHHTWIAPILPGIVRVAVRVPQRKPVDYSVLDTGLFGIALLCLLMEVLSRGNKPYEESRKMSDASNTKN